MNIKPFTPPQSRALFERNLNLLRELYMQGRIHIPTDFSVEGLLRLRRLPNGRIDLLSVDEGTRLQANMMADESPWHSIAEQDAIRAGEESGRGSAEQAHQGGNSKPK